MSLDPLRAHQLEQERAELRERLGFWLDYYRELVEGGISAESAEAMVLGAQREVSIERMRELLREARAVDS